MKKVLSVFCFFFAVALGCNGDNQRFANRVLQRVNGAKSLLQERDISSESVTDFTQTVEAEISRMGKYDDDDTITALIGLCKGYVKVAKALWQYKTKPTEEGDEYLRSWANCDTFWAGIIIPEMNKQSDPRWKFER